MCVHMCANHTLDPPAFLFSTSRFACHSSFFSNSLLYLSDQEEDFPLFSICWNKGHMHGQWLKMLSAEGLDLLWVLLDFYLQSTHRILFIALKNRGDVEL